MKTKTVKNIINQFKRMKFLKFLFLRVIVSSTLEIWNINEISRIFFSHSIQNTDAINKQNVLTQCSKCSVSKKISTISS